MSEKRESVSKDALRWNRASIAQDIVIKDLKQGGYEVLTTGWPDLVAFRDGDVRFIEVKSGRSYVQPFQRRLHAVLQRVGIKVEVIAISKSEMQEYLEGRRKPTGTRG